MEIELNWNKAVPPPSRDRLGWDASNQALARLLDCHRRELTAAAAMAEKIGRAIDRLTPRMEALCRRTCRFCPDSCCITTTVWFDFQDLLSLHLRGEPIPACQAVSDPGQDCPFLGHHGCRLFHRQRPWMCIQYLCPPQRSILEKVSPMRTAGLMDTIAAIGRLRSEMEAAVVDCIRRKTAPVKPRPALSPVPEKMETVKSEAVP